MPTTEDSDRPTVRIGTWNVAWAVADSERGTRVAAALKAPDCDVVCVTEGCADILPAGGHTVDAVPDGGRVPEEPQRNVLLWSRLNARSIIDGGVFGLFDGRGAALG